MKLDKLDIIAILLIIISAIYVYYIRTAEDDNAVTEVIDEKSEDEIPVSREEYETATAEADIAEEEEVEEEIDKDLCTHADPVKRNGHMCVDLGTSVLWATCNLGANGDCTKEGDHFSFGETSPREGDYSSIEYRKNRRVDYDTLPNNRLMPQDDAARALWGGKWRTPTRKEVDELERNCNLKWTKNYKKSGVEGCIISCKCKKNPQSIFIPVSGIKRNDSTLDYESGIMNQKGINLWTSTVEFYEHGSSTRKSNWQFMIYDNKGKDIYINTLCSCMNFERMAIRPVISK